MNLFKRATLYITRKKKKSIIMLFILFCMATAVLSGISIKKATNIAKQNSSRDMANKFEVTANGETNINGTIPENLLKKISNINGVESYDGIIEDAKLDFKEITGVEPKNSMIEYVDERYNNVFAVEGHTSTELDTKFVSKSFKLVEGRHIIETDKEKILIHRALAEKNNLKVGDVLKATKSQLYDTESSNSKNECTLEIVGIFESENTESIGDKLEIPENLILSDINTLKTLYEYSDENVQYTKAIFNTSNNVEEVISQVKNISEDWQQYEIEKSEDTFLALTKTFDVLDKIIKIVLIGAIIVGIMILSLVLIFWIQGRIRETGILLSLGVSKFNIIAQYIVELLIISLLAFGASYFSSKAISQNIGNTIVNQASKQATEEVGNSYKNSYLTNTTLNEIDVNVQVKELIYVYIIGSGIIVFSVLLSSVSVIRLKPKEILSKMS